MAKQINPSRLAPKLTRIEEVKKILDSAYGLTPITQMGEAPQRVPMCDIDGLARQIDQILALLQPKIEEAERERIAQWGEEYCYDHIIMDVPIEIGGGTVRKATRKRRRCVECWRSLKGGK